MTYSFRRPKTSSGLSSIHNDSTIYSPLTQTSAPTSTSTSANPANPLTTRRSTQEFVSRPSFSSTRETRLVTKSTSNLALAFTRRNRDPDHRKDREGEGRLRRGVDDVKYAAAAMVRKALQGSREMRPIDRMKPVHTHSAADSSHSFSRDPSSSPSSNTRSRDRPPTRAGSISGLRSQFNRRRGAVSTRSVKSYANNPSERDLAPPEMSMLTPNVISPTMPLPIPGSAARASAAEHNKSQQLTRSDTKLSRSRNPKMQVDEMMEDEMTGRVEKTPQSQLYGMQSNQNECSEQSLLTTLQIRSKYYLPNFHH
jgi:hypothetical protein